MLAEEAQNTAKVIDAGKLKFYRLIGEDYKAMKDGRISTIEEVKEKIDQRKQDRGVNDMVVTERIQKSIMDKFDKFGEEIPMED